MQAMLVAELPQVKRVTLTAHMEPASHYDLRSQMGLLTLARHRCTDTDVVSV